MAFTSFRGRVPGPSLGGAATPPHTASEEKAAADLAPEVPGPGPAHPERSARDDWRCGGGGAPGGWAEGAGLGGDKSVLVPRLRPVGRLLGWCGGGVRSRNSWGPAGITSVDPCELQRVSGCGAPGLSPAYLLLQVTADFEGQLGPLAFAGRL